MLRVMRILLVVFAVMSAGFVSAQSPALEVFDVTTPDGVVLAAQRWGNPEGQEILFIHGFSQSHLSWSEQVTDPALGDYDMVSYDLRGHGESEKVTDASYYEGQDWAGEVRAVIEVAGFERPVLVGWSYAGRIIAEYLAVFGDDDLAGIIIVDGVARGGEGYFGPGATLAGGMTSDVLATSVQATIDFVKQVTVAPLPEAVFDTTLAYNMVTPPEVRANLLGGLPAGADYDSVWSGVTAPFLVIQGVEDQVVLVAMAQYLAEIVPGAELSLYEDIGHAPFLEAPTRFNEELVQFMQQTNP